MHADNKKKLQRTASDFLIRYGAGAHYIQKFTSAKSWNAIAWVVIAIGVIGWIFFLMWQP